MGDSEDRVRITAADVSAAVPLCEPVEEGTFGYRVVNLDFSAKEPGRFGKMFGGGDGISVSIDLPAVEGGVPIWSTQVRFERGLDADREFSRAGLEWPIWWAIPDLSHFIEKARILQFTGFATAELALPWFVRLHAVVAGVDPLAPVVVTRSVSSPMRSNADREFDDTWDDVAESEFSDDLKGIAYGEWQARAHEHGFG
jgi:hypothetical protein